jgi:hypothetical protein
MRIAVVASDKFQGVYREHDGFFEMPQHCVFSSEKQLNVVVFDFQKQISITKHQKSAFPL